MKSKVLLTLASAALVLGGLAGCQVTPSDNVDSEIYNVYVMYQTNGGTLTYEQWLASIKGEKGDKGDTGAQGPKGDKGDTGAAGAAGADGEKGDKGDTGAAGQDGASILTGEGAPAANLGKQGDSYIDTATFDYYIKGESGWTKVGNIKGATGEKGDKGDAGEAGSQGEKGDKGDTGAAGEKGDKGDTGEKGDKGDTGATGETGPQGPKGDTGEQGPKGDQGETGAAGAAGEKGDTGEKGDKGDTGATAYSSTILPSNDGYILPSVGSAVVGADISFRICPNKDAVVETFFVNGVSIDVATLEKVEGTDSDLLYKTKMVEGGFVVRATYRYVKVEIAGSLTLDAKNRITSADKYTASFTGDVTLNEMAPLAKKKTTYDLNGHTLTVDASFGNPLFVTDNDQELEITNGKIVFVGANNNGILLSGESNLLLDGVEIDYKSLNSGSTYAAVLFDMKATATIKNSAITSNSAFCVSTNNEQGSGKPIVIEGSTIIANAADYDDCGLLINTEKVAVELRNSRFVGNRQGAIIRTGDAKVEGCTFEITGEWLKDEAHATKNEAYLNGAWKTGNEVPSAALVIGDACDSAYDTPVTISIGKDSTFVGPEANKVVVRSDSKNITTVKTDFDSRTLFEANKDDKSVVTLGDNIEYVTVGDLAKMTDKSENKGNLFYVTGVLIGDDLGEYGKCTIVDPETGDSLLVYGCLAALKGTVEESFTYENGAYTANFKTNTNSIGTGNLGKLTTLVGTFTYFTSAGVSTPELKSAAIYSQEENFVKTKIAIDTAENGSIVLKNSEGEVVTADTELTYGEEITIESATASEGYELSKVEVTVDGVTNNYKVGNKFKVGLTNKASATFKEAGSTPAEELQHYTYTFKDGDTTTSGKTGIDGKWSASSALYIGFDSSNGRGLQIGSTKNAQTSGWTLTAPASSFGSKVVGVAIESAVTSKGKSMVSIVAGEHEFYLNNSFSSTTAAACGSTTDTLLSLEEAVTSGDIVITLEALGKYGMYIKSVTVWYY